MNIRKAVALGAGSFFGTRSHRRPFRLHKLLFPSILAFAAIAGGCILAAQDKVRLPGEDWVSLFNGNDLSGWTKIGNESWTVENGLIHGKGLTQDYGLADRKETIRIFNSRCASNAWVTGTAVCFSIRRSSQERRMSPKVCSSRSIAK